MTMNANAREAAFRRRSCRIKKRYESKPSQFGMLPYRCRFCGGWHMATPKERKTAGKVRND